MLLGVLAVGCAQHTAKAPTPKNARVAGTQENYQNPSATAANTPTLPTVLVNVTDKGIAVLPAQIPPGTFNVKIVNSSSHAQTLAFAGKGFLQSTQSLKPGDAATLTMQNLQLGEYKISGPVGAGNKHLNAVLTVAKGAPMPQTMTPLPKPTVATPPPALPANNARDRLSRSALTGCAVCLTPTPKTPGSIGLFE